MANTSDVSVSLGMVFDGSSIQKTISSAMTKIKSSVDNSTKQMGDNMSKNIGKSVDKSVKELSKLDQEIDKIMKDQSRIDKFGLGTDNLAKSRAKSIAALLKKEQGLDDSQSMIKAYDIVGRKAREAGEIVAESTNKAQKKTNKFFDLFKKKSNAAKNQASDIGGSLSLGIGGALKKLAGLAAGAFAVTKMVQFGKECVDLGSALEETRSMSKIVFGDMYDDLDKWASKSIETMGISETNAKKYSSTLASIFKSAGGSGKEIYDISTNLTQLSADMASFHNLENAGEAFEKIKAGLVGSSEPLLSLGIDLREGAVEAFALANGLTDNYNALSNLEKMQIRYKALLAQTTDVQGDFVRNQNSWAVQTSILNQRLEAMKANLGQAFINILTPVLRTLNLLMDKLVVVSNLFSNFTSKIFGKAEVTTTKVALSMEDGLSGIIDSAESASDAIGGVADATKKASKQALGFDELNVLSKPDESSTSGAIGGTGSSTITEETKETNDALDEQETILDKVLKKFKEFDLSNLKNAFENLKNSISPIIDLIGQGLKWAFDNVLVPFSKWTIEKALPSTMNLLAGAFELIGAVAANIGPKLVYIWDNFLKPIMSFVGDAIISALDGIAGGLSSIADNETAVDILGNLVLALGGMMVASKVIGIITGIANALTLLGGSLKVLAGGELLKATSIFGKLANVFSLVAGGAGTLHEAMVLVFGKIGTVLTGVGTLISGAVIAVKNFFSMWEKGWNVLESILMAIGIAIAAVGAIILGVPASVAAVAAAVIGIVANVVIVIKQNWNMIVTDTKRLFTDIGNFLVDCWNWIVDTTLGLIDTLVSTIERNWNSFIEFTKFIFNSVGTFLSNTWNSIVDNTKRLISNLLSTIETNWNKLKEATISIFNSVKDFIVTAWTNIKNFLTEIVSSTTSFVIEKWTLFKEKISSVISSIRDFLINAWTTIKEKVFSLISNLIETLKQKFEDFKNGIISIFNSIKSFITNLWTETGNFVIEKVTNLKDKVISGFNMIKDGASSIFTGMKDTISGVFSNLISIVKSPINTIISLVNKAIDGINSLSIDVPDWVSELTGMETFGFNLPKIPMLANGGLVKSPTLAMVGEGREDEIVSPLSTLRQIENEGSSQTNALLNQMIQQNQQMMQIMSQLLAKDSNLYLDGYQMATVLSNIQNSENRRRG